jgi:hypothetical protein
MPISCDRCGREFKKMDNLRRHLNRVYICQPIKSNVSVTVLREKYACKKGVYTCENCGKVYKTSSGKCKHKKKCVVIKESEKDNIIKEKDELLKEALAKICEEQQTRSKLEQQVKELLLQKQCVQNITNNNFIIINNFGEENTDYLKNDEKFLKKCIQSPIKSIQKYLDAVHFNKEHPENSNIKLTNLQSPFMDYFTNGNWNKIEQRVLIPNIINKSVKTIHSLVGENDELQSEEWYKYRNELNDGAMKQKVRIKAKSYIYNRSLL